MNVPSFVRRVIVGTGLALAVAGMAVTVADAQQAGVSTSGRTSIVTDKATYVIGEPITITYTLPGPGHIRITDHQAGKVSTLRSGYSDQPGGRFQGTVTPPAGTECLRIEYRDSRNRTSTAETCFEVKDMEPKHDQPQGRAPAPGLYTLQNRWSGGALDSNGAKQVYGHAPNGGAFQKWMFEAAPDGHVFLRDLATGYYLDSNPAGDVYTLEKNSGQYQQWKLEPITGEHAGGWERLFVLRNRATGLPLLDADNDKIRTGVPTVPVENSVYHHWQLTAVQP